MTEQEFNGMIEQAFIGGSSPQFIFTTPEIHRYIDVAVLIDEAREREDWKQARIYRGLLRSLGRH